MRKEHDQFNWLVNGLSKNNEAYILLAEQSTVHLLTYLFYKQRDNSFTRFNICIKLTLVYFPRVGIYRVHSRNWIHTKKPDIRYEEMFTVFRVTRRNFRSSIKVLKIWLFVLFNIQINTEKSFKVYFISIFFLPQKCIFYQLIHKERKTFLLR